MKYLPAQYLSSFCMSLHLALKAGVSISESVTIFRDEESDKGNHAMLETVGGELDLGSTLADSLKKVQGFPEYLVDMVEIGEKTGTLDSTLLALSRNYDRQESLSKSIRGAITYPIMMLAVLLLVLIVFVVKILPIFYDVYTQLDAQMSGVAMGALNFGKWLGASWIPVVICVAVLAVLCVVFRQNLSKLFSKIFMGGALGNAMRTARFSAVLSMTLESGLNTDDALIMSSRLFEGATAENLKSAAKDAAEGQSFAECVEKAGIFSKTYNRMLAIGVKTGASDSVMEEIARRSGDDANDRLEAFVAKIEPTLVIIMSALIGLLLLSVMLPLAGIMSAI
ncbi:MAG: type II secretion system F family protein [Oscillospiraceae bacterium]|jgi:type IV pilus assembly protein PilC|nr:type II secretion system F family protein [Oscillospiraceae bacterium]